MTFRATLSGVRNVVAKVNGWALARTAPGPHHLRKAIKIGLSLGGLAFLKGAGVVLLALVGIDIGYDAITSAELDRRTTIGFALAASIVAPVLETWMMTILYRVLYHWLRLGLFGYVTVSAVFWGANHIVAAWPAFIFIIMSYQYVAFRDALGRSRAFCGVALTHSVYNTIITAIVQLALALPS